MRGCSSKASAADSRVVQIHQSTAELLALGRARRACMRAEVASPGNSGFSSRFNEPTVAISDKSPALLGLCGLLRSADGVAEMEGVQRRSKDAFQMR